MSYHQHIPSNQPERDAEADTPQLFDVLQSKADRMWFSAQLRIDGLDACVETHELTDAQVGLRLRQFAPNPHTVVRLETRQVSEDSLVTYIATLQANALPLRVVRFLPVIDPKLLRQDVERAKSDTSLVADLASTLSKCTGVGCLLRRSATHAQAKTFGDVFNSNTTSSVIARRANSNASQSYVDFLKSQFEHNSDVMLFKPVNLLYYLIDMSIVDLTSSIWLLPFYPIGNGASYGFSGNALYDRVFQTLTELYQSSEYVHRLLRPVFGLPKSDSSIDASMRCGDVDSRLSDANPVYRRLYTYFVYVQQTVSDMLFEKITGLSIGQSTRFGHRFALFNLEQRGQPTPASQLFEIESLPYMVYRDMSLSVALDPQILDMVRNLVEALRVLLEQKAEQVLMFKASRKRQHANSQLSARLSTKTSKKLVEAICNDQQIVETCSMLVALTARLASDYMMELMAQTLRQASQQAMAGSGSGLCDGSNHDVLRQFVEDCLSAESTGDQQPSSSVDLKLRRALQQYLTARPDDTSAGASAGEGESQRDSNSSQEKLYNNIARVVRESLTCLHVARQQVQQGADHAGLSAQPNANQAADNGEGCGAADGAADAESAASRMLLSKCVPDSIDFTPKGTTPVQRYGVPLFYSKQYKKFVCVKFREAGQAIAEFQRQLRDGRIPAAQSFTGSSLMHDIDPCSASRLPEPDAVDAAVSGLTHMLIKTLIPTSSDNGFSVSMASSPAAAVAAASSSALSMSDEQSATFAEALQQASRCESLQSSKSHAAHVGQQVQQHIDVVERLRHQRCESHELDARVSSNQTVIVPLLPSNSSSSSLINASSFVVPSSSSAIVGVHANPRLSKLDSMHYWNRVNTLRRQLSASHLSSLFTAINGRKNYGWSTRNVLAASHHGRIDVRRLARFSQDLDLYPFKSKVDRMYPDLSVTVLVDNSGSIGDNIYGSYAVALEIVQALRRVPGVRSRICTFAHVALDFDEPMSSARIVGADGGTPLDVSLRLYLGEFDARSPRRHKGIPILLVISDGIPSNVENTIIMASLVQRVSWLFGLFFLDKSVFDSHLCDYRPTMLVPSRLEPDASTPLHKIRLPMFKNLVRHIDRSKFSKADELPPMQVQSELRVGFQLLESAGSAPKANHSFSQYMLSKDYEACLSFCLNGSPCRAFSKPSELSAIMFLLLDQLMKFYVGSHV